MRLNDIVLDNIYDSLRVILDAIGLTKVPVVFDNENGLEPLNTYCVVSLLDRERVGRTSEATFLTENEEMWRTEFFTLYLQLSFLGDKASSVAWDFDDCVPASRSFLEEFQKRNLGYIRKSRLRRSPQPRETKWKDGWNVDLDLSFAIQSRQVMDWIEYITVNGEIIRIYEGDLEERVIDTGEDRTVDDGEVRQVLVN